MRSQEPVDPVASPSTRAPGAPEDDKPKEDEWSGGYSWRIENFSKLTDKLYSERFEVATYYWRLLIFPTGNKTGSYLSAYLDAPEAQYTPAQMSPKASFKLHVINQVDQTHNITKEAQHEFTQAESDWGFTSFVQLDEVNNPANGFLVNDTLLLRVDLTVLRDEKYNMDARKATGHVGLKNQGATCYMNSLLQYLYNLNYFRTAVYHMPTNENEEASKSLPLALQSLFYKLQYSRTPVSTKDLTKSFGWGTSDAFMQHDVQELNVVLCERLGEKMKGTKVERVFNELFEGHTYNYIECINVDYKSSRKESFMDLQLVIKGCKDVRESLIKFTEEEVLDGNNQYNADGHGMQDARKGIKFGTLPPVLQLHLKRFEYDFQRDQGFKVNDRYEFPEELDLDFDDRRIFSVEADKNVRNIYRLHSVLVHSGAGHGGHYFAYVRPDGKRWLKFDDDHVEEVEQQEAIDQQFGAGGEDGAYGSMRYGKHSNAYMLVYIRASDWPRIMCEVTKEDIVEHLRERLEQEQIAKEALQKMKQEAHLYCTLKVATDQDLREQIGPSGQVWFDLVNHDKLPQDHIFRVKKNIRFSEFKAMVAEKLGVPVAAQRYWIWTARENHTFRPNRPLTAQEEDLPLMELREHRDHRSSANAKQSLMDIKLFLETPITFYKEQGWWALDPEGELPKRSKSEVMLFFKHYDPDKQVIRYAGRANFNLHTKLQELYPFLRLICGLPENEDLDCYEEVKFEPSVPTVPMEPGSPLGEQANLEDGDILIIQRKVRQEERANIRLPSAPAYLQYIQSRRVVTMKRLEEPREEGIRLELLREMDYDQVTAALAKELQVPSPRHLRLTQQNAYSHQPQKNPVRFRCGDRAPGRLEHLLQHSSHVNDVLYYEVLDMPLDELEKLKTLRVAFHNDKAEFQAYYTVRLPPETGEVADVLRAVQAQLGSEFEDKVLRLMEVYNSRVYKVCKMDDRIESMNETYWQMRAEVVPEEQQRPLQEGERDIQVCHFSQDKEFPATHPSTFGDPLLIRIRDDEPVGEIKRRIQAKLGVADEVFAKWRFAFVPARCPPEYVNDEDTLGEWFAKLPLPQMTDANYLGMQHEDKGPRRHTNQPTYEKAIKIHS